MIEKVTISKAEYDRLCRSEDKLSALEAYGVDNWEGYAEALGSIYGDEEEDEEDERYGTLDRKD